MFWLIAFALSFLDFSLKVVYGTMAKMFLTELNEINFWEIAELLEEGSDWKLSKINGCWTEMVHFWPFIGEVEIRSRDGKFFEKL